METEKTIISIKDGKLCRKVFNTFPKQFENGRFDFSKNRIDARFMCSSNVSLVHLCLKNKIFEVKEWSTEVNNEEENVKDNIDRDDVKLDIKDIKEQDKGINDKDKNDKDKNDKDKDKNEQDKEFIRTEFELKQLNLIINNLVPASGDKKIKDDEDQIGGSSQDNCASDNEDSDTEDSDTEYKSNNKKKGKNKSEIKSSKKRRLKKTKTEQKCPIQLEIEENQIVLIRNTKSRTRKRSLNLLNIGFDTVDEITTNEQAGCKITMSCKVFVEICNQIKNTVYFTFSNNKMTIKSKEPFDWDDEYRTYDDIDDPEHIVITYYGVSDEDDRDIRDNRDDQDNKDNKSDKDDDSHIIIVDDRDTKNDRKNNTNKIKASFKVCFNGALFSSFKIGTKLSGLVHLHFSSNKGPCRIWYNIEDDEDKGFLKFWLAPLDESAISSSAN